MNARTCYEEKADATRSRRRKAGQYATPTELRIFNKTLARGGDANLTANDITVLAGCKWLPASLQRRYQAMAAAQ
jgi:hypothetical protein